MPFQIQLPAALGFHDELYQIRNNAARQQAAGDIRIGQVITKSRQDCENKRKSQIDQGQYFEIKGFVKWQLRGRRSPVSADIFQGQRFLLLHSEYHCHREDDQSKEDQAPFGHGRDGCRAK